MPRLKRENEMLKVNKSEIEQLKEQAEKYKSFMSALNPQIEEFHFVLLKLHLNNKNSKNSKNKSSSGNKEETENITIHGH